VEQPPTLREDVPVVAGELSGMEVSVPEPEYPAKAKSDGISGRVTVRIRVNQRGRVISARSSTGDWRLRAAAVEAAQKATFSPEKLAFKGGIVSGTISYNFIPQSESPATTGSPATAQTDPLIANNGSPATESSTAKAGVGLPIVGGDLVGSESHLPQPNYPEKAKSRGIYGIITVVVRVNRAGKVISWRTSKGDSQLRAAALKAAKISTFSPEKLPGSGEVVGTITYNFKP
jgi:TonB family protein